MPVLCITAPSGVGKSALMREFFTAVPKAHLLTSTTTRAPSPRDLQLGLESEYEYKNEDEFERMAPFFLQVFGEYGSRYGTVRKRFEKALDSTEPYLCALTIPGAQFFLAEAEKRKKAGDLRFVYLNLEYEEERARRLTERGETDEARFKPELASWFAAARSSGVPYKFLNAGQPTRRLVQLILGYWRF